MKQILIAFLLIGSVFAIEQEQTEIASENGIQDYIEIIKCFLRKKELIQDVKELFSVITSGDFSKILPTLLKLYNDGRSAIKECIPTLLGYTISGLIKCSKCVKLCTHRYFMNTLSSCMKECKCQ